MRRKTYGTGRAIFDIGVFSTAINLLLLASPLYLLQVYDRVLSSSSADTLLFMTLIVIAAFIVLGALEAIRSAYAARVANRVDFNVTRRALENTMAVQGAATGDPRVLRDLATVRQFLTSKLVFVLFDLPFAPVFIAILYFVHPVLFWITLAGAGMLILLAFLTQFATAGGAEAEDRAGQGNFANASLILRASEMMKGLGMTARVLDRWESEQVSSVELADRRARIVAVMSGLSRIVRMVLQIAVIGAGAWLVLEREMTAGMIFAASIISGRALQPVDQLIGSWRQLGDTRRAWARIRQITSARGEDAAKVSLPRATGLVTAEQLVVTTGAGTGRPVQILKGISFLVPAGRSVAIIGPSGAGKSTLMRVIAGAIRPHSGSVRFDANDVTNFTAEDHARNVGYIDQRVDILPGTVAENIARFDPDADDATIVEAAERARVDSLFKALPDGFSTMLGPMHHVLSGGQLQQLALARALYRDPPILLFDEPNTALDPEGQQAFFRALADARSRGRTIIIATQRDDVLSHVDTVLVLAGGQIKDYGPRDEVIARLRGKAQPAPARAPATVQQGKAKSAQGVVSPFAGLGPGLRPATARQGGGDDN